MMNYSALFPWRRLEKGQGFFIPCVNTEEVRLAGLNEALRQRVRSESQAAKRLARPCNKPSKRLQPKPGEVWP